MGVTLRRAYWHSSQKPGPSSHFSLCSIGWGSDLPVVHPSPLEVYAQLTVRDVTAGDVSSGFPFPFLGE